MAFDKTKRRKHTSASHFVWRATVSLLALAATSDAAWSFGNGRINQAPLLPIPPSSHIPKPGHPPITGGRGQRFTLRHTFAQGLFEHPHLHGRLDVKPAQLTAAAARLEQDDSEDGVGPLYARSSPLTIQRLANRRISDVTSTMAVAKQQGTSPYSAVSEWAMDSVPGPNVTDRDTVLNMALMAANAYNENREDSEWTDAKAPFNLSLSFGWQKDSLRGHVFADDTNSTIVISIKGTSAAVFDGAGTTTNDKVNDNLFFSCCCGQGGHYLWLKVCSCMASSFTCNESCLLSALKDKSRYYYAALELYGNITDLYPDANVWLTGHSLGGSIASLLGLTFGLPVVTFEAVPDALPASRLGLPTPPGYAKNIHQTRQYTGAYHFGHTADPVYMGTCNAATSACTLGFYAMESVCHTGHRCVWDPVGDWKWRVSLTTHKIRSSIADVYTVYDTLPTCEQDTECYDCGAWKYFRGNGSEGTAPPTSSTTSTSYTRTETCKTPGWWGCLDETTTTSTTSTTTFTTTTCSSYGWFGNCLDPITTTVTSATTLPAHVAPHQPSITASAAPSSTCETPGYIWGCKDPTSKPESRTRPEPTACSPLATQSICHTPGWFWDCKDRTVEAEQHVITPAP